MNFYFYSKVMSIDRIVSQTHWRTKDRVIRAFEAAGIRLRSRFGLQADIRNDIYRQLLERYYNGPLTANVESVVGRMINTAQHLNDPVLSTDDQIKRKHASDKSKSQRNRRRFFTKAIVKAIFDLEEKQKTEAEVNAILEQMPIYEEYIKEEAAYPEWNNYIVKAPKYYPNNDALTRFENTIRKLEQQPFGTTIDLTFLNERIYQKAGEMLLKWYNDCIAPRMNEKMLVEYKIRGDSKPRRFRVTVEDARIRKLFAEDALFSFGEDYSNIDSGDNGKLCLEWVESITFFNYENWVPRPDSRRSIHKDGFFPRKLSGNYRLMEKVLKPLQVYASYTTEKGTVKKDVNTACFIHALREAGVDEDTLAKINSFVGFQKRITRNIWTEIGNAFGLRFHLRIFDERKGKIDNGNQSNNGWYGAKEGREIRLAEYMEHVFIDKELPVNLFAVRNWNQLVEQVKPNPSDKATISKMLKACEFRGNSYKTKESRAKADSLSVLIEINKQNGFQPINAMDADVDAAKIFCNEIVEEEAIAAPYNIKLHTRNISLKKHKNQTNEKPCIYYADFETCKRIVKDKRNARTEEIPFMLCITNQSGTDEKTYTGTNMQARMLNDLPNNAVVYFHNLGFDGNFFYNFACKDIIKKGNRIMSMSVEHDNKRFTLKDSYSLLPEKLAKFPKLFPQAFEKQQVQKEYMPYDYYTYERLFEQSEPIGNIFTVIDEMNPSFDDVIAFLENLDETRSWTNIKAGEFDMIKYCKFYCLQDIRVLRIGFEAFVEAAKGEPICMNVHEVLTVPALANEYMKRNVFAPNRCIYELNGAVQRFCQGAVYGGRCMTASNYRYDVSTKLADFDAKSLYPSAMARMFTVERVPKFYEHKDTDAVYNKDNLPDILIHAFDDEQTKPTQDKYISQFIVDIEITAIGIERQFPLIVERTKTKQMNVNKCTTMRVDMIMLQDLITFQDISFKLGNGYIWTGNRDHRIRKEITKLFNLRAEYQKTGNPTQQIIKLIMNSAYGKSIQKPIKTFMHFVKKDEADWYIRDRYHQIHCDYILEDGNHLIELTKQKATQFNNVLFGVTVLSMSKRIMNEVMCTAEDNGINIYYQDTDSMHIEYDKLPLLTEAFKAKYNRELIGDQLGNFHNDFDEISDAYCTRHISLGKKMYVDVLANDKGETALHYRLKGVPQEVIRNHAKKHFNGDIVKLYEYLYASDKNTINFNLLDGKVCMFYSKTGSVMTRDRFDREVRATCPMKEVI